MWISLTLMSWLKRSVPCRRKLVHCSNPRLMSSAASSFFLYSFQAIFSKFSLVILVTCPAALTEFPFKPQISGASTRKPGIANQSALVSYLLARLNQHPPLHQLAFLSIGWWVAFFSSGSWPCILPRSIFFACSHSHFSFGHFFSNPDLHSTLPPLFSYILALPTN